MNFHQDIRDYIKDELRYFKIEYSPSPDIDQDLLKLFTIHRKLIIPIHRQVKMSKELQKKISGNYKYRSEIGRLWQMLQEGIDVNAHQTKNLFNPNVHDHLVYDWNIYHLHLSFEKDKKGYHTKRTKEILFVYITPGLALLLDVCGHPPHNVFADKVFLEIIDNNWPEILTAIAGVDALSQDISTQDRFTLRKHNVNEGALEVNGRIVYAPGLGQASSGHSAGEVMKMNQMNRWLKTNEEIIMQNREMVDKLFMHQYKLEERPAYKIVFTGQGPQVQDENSGICLVKYLEIIPINTGKS
ncbi:MAG TPA: hypothetical protein VHN59_10270 [Chitinophagaceae bacterium]|nr:hypothetical protein [Chitinophagaceae bacterium]